MRRQVRLLADWQLKLQLQLQLQKDNHERLSENGRRFLCPL